MRFESEREEYHHYENGYFQFKNFPMLSNFTIVEAELHFNHIYIINLLYVYYRLTPGSEAVLDIPEAVYYTARGASRGRYSKQLRGISGIYR